MGLQLNAVAQLGDYITDYQLGEGSSFISGIFFLGRFFAYYNFIIMVVLDDIMYFQNFKIRGKLLSLCDIFLFEVEGGGGTSAISVS